MLNLRLRQNIASEASEHVQYEDKAWDILCEENVGDREEAELRRLGANVDDYRGMIRIST